MIIHKNKLHISIVKKALIFPATSENIGSTETIQGIQTNSRTKNNYAFGLYRYGKNFTSYKKRRDYLKGNTRVVLTGKYLYLGTMFTDHFGHFLSESIHRMWACRYYEAKVKGFIVLSPHKKLEKTKIFTDVCKILGVNTKKIILINTLSEIENLIVPHLGGSLGLVPENWYLKELSNRKILEKLKNLKLPKKLIIRRGNQYLSRIIGVNYFANLIKKSGFTEFYPENHSLVDQLKYIVSADYIIWEEGSACHLLELLPYMKYKKSILIKRKEKKSTIDIVLESRDSNLITYKKVKKIFAGKRVICDISKFSNPKDFHSFLINEKIINDKDFKFLDYKKFEIKDFIYFYYQYIKINVIWFSVQKIKPRVGISNWEILKNIFKKIR